MSFNLAIQQNQLSTGTTALSGAAPQTGAGTAVNMNAVEKGTLCANVYAQATTNTLTITGKWQVSDNNSTWRDAYVANRPANVTIVTGTGAAVSDNIVVSAPDCVYSKKYARFAVVTGAAAAGAGDEYSISYNWRKAGAFTTY